MSGGMPADLTGDTLVTRPTADGQRRAAVRAVMWRVEQGAMSRGEARVVLDVLGLVQGPGELRSLTSSQRIKDAKRREKGKT